VPLYESAGQAASMGSSWNKREEKYLACALLATFRSAEQMLSQRALMLFAMPRSPTPRFG